MDKTERRRTRRTHTTGRRRVGTALIAAGLLLVFLWLGIKAVRAYNAAQDGLSQLQSLQQLLDRPFAELMDDLPGIRAQVETIRQDMATLRAETRVLDPLLRRLGWVPRYGGALAATPHLTAMAAYLSAAGADLLEVAAVLQPLLEETGEETLARSIEALQEQQPLLEQAQIRLEYAAYERSFLQAGRLANGPYAPVAALFDELDPLLGPAVEALDTLNAFLPQADSFLGMDAPRRYIILGQSNFELRATGGFIGSLGVVTVDRGRIVDLDYRHSPDWDNPEREKVEAPRPYVRYMRFGAWFIRDANYYADYPTSAETVEMFWELDGHGTVDGVIAADLYAVETLIDAMGPMLIPSFGLAIGGGDVLESIWEGYRQDPGFLSVLVGSLAERLQEPGLFAPEALPPLLRALNRSLEERHILLYFNQPELQQAVLQAGWGGAVRMETGDYLMVVDSDFSWAEVNRFIDEEIRYHVTVDRSMNILTSTVTVNYWNHFDRWRSGGTNEPFGGACFDRETEDIFYSPGCYGDYLRLYVPRGSRFVSAEGFYDGMDYETEAGRTVIGGYVRIFPGEQHTVSITYVPQAGTVDGQYRLTLQKQPGTDARPVQVEVEVIGSRPAAAAVQTDLRVDRVLTAAWQGEYLVLSGEGAALVQEDPAFRARQEAYAEGMARWEEGRREEAIERWRRGEAAGLVLDQVVLLLSQGETEQARALGQAALELLPDSARAHYLLGRVEMAAGNDEAARSALEQAVALDPENRSARLELGLLYESLGQPAQAAQHLPHADVREATHILWLRVWEHFNGGEEQAGQDALTLIIAVDPQDAHAHFLLADRLRAQGRYEEALGAYEQARRVAPDDVRYYLGRGRLFAAQGDGEAAIAELQRAVEAAPLSAEAWFTLGQSLWQVRGDAAAAAAAMEQALQIYPNASYAVTLGSTLQRAGDPAGALAAYERAVTLPGRTPATWSTLAQAYQAEERWEEAAGAYAQAVALQPSSAAMHANLAHAYAQAGQIEEAIAAYGAALALEPDRTDWREAMEALQR